MISPVAQYIQCIEQSYCPCCPVAKCYELIMPLPDIPFDGFYRACVGLREVARVRRRIDDMPQLGRTGTWSSCTPTRCSVCPVHRLCPLRAAFYSRFPSSQWERAGHACRRESQLHCDTCRVEGTHYLYYYCSHDTERVQGTGEERTSYAPGGSINAKTILQLCNMAEASDGYSINYRRMLRLLCSREIKQF